MVLCVFAKTSPCRRELEYYITSRALASNPGRNTSGSEEDSLTVLRRLLSYPASGWRAPETGHIEVRLGVGFGVKAVDGRETGFFEQSIIICIGSKMVAIMWVVVLLCSQSTQPSTVTTVLLCHGGPETSIFIVRLL